MGLVCMPNELIIKVRDDIKQLMIKDELILPTLPEMALRIREIAGNPDTSINDIVSELSYDPAICARILRIANSPMVRSVIPIKDLNTAVSRLGIRFTSNLVISFATEQMFQATNDLIDHYMHEAWQNAIEVASATQVVARHFTKLPADQALLAGLIHRIGVLPILTYAENNPELLANQTALDLIIDKLHSPLGAYVLKQWNLSTDLVTVAKEYQEIERDRDTPDLTDLVQVVVLQRHVGSSLPLGQINLNTVGAFDRVGFSADLSLYEIAELMTEVDETKAALSPG